MKGAPAIYRGRIVDKVNFRTNIYDSKGKKKLVESWEAFEAAMQSGLWFATREEAMESMTNAQEMEKSEDDLALTLTSKSKSKLKPKPVKVEKIEQKDSKIPKDKLDNMVFEVTDENK
jgi:hypothetical protein